MPINRYPSDLPQSLWWIHPQQPPLMDPAPLKATDHHCVAPPDFNLNRYNEGGESENPNDRRQLRISSSADQFGCLDGVKEAMFEKPLTPSDVGKLNRLVIPKQHAEKYFPLGGGTADSGGGGGGLLLSFEDESGKLWRFRYSYWNSSQSYVLTKGWSRFVKEKQLDAGDVVLFLRHRVDPDRLFIGWRRRGQAAAAAGVPGAAGGGAVGGNSGEGGWGRRVYYSAHAYPVHSQPGPHGNGPCFPYQPDCLHAGVGGQNQTSSSSGNLKTLRLFGVNMECHQQQQSPDESKPSTPDGSSMSSQGGQPHHYHYTTNLVPNPSNHMAQDTNFLKGVSQMRYNQG